MKHDANYRPLDPKSVARLANDLYKLKHFGKMLENAKLTIAAVHEGTYPVNGPITYTAKALLGHGIP